MNRVKLVGYMGKGRPKGTGKEERLPLSSEHVAFGKRLALLRGERSQQDVARLANVNNSTISDLENGYTDPKLSTLVQIAAAIGVPVAEILGSRIEQGAAVPVSRDLSRDDRLAALEGRLAALSERMSAREVREADRVKWWSRWWLASPPRNPSFRRGNVEKARPVRDWGLLPKLDSNQRPAD